MKLRLTLALAALFAFAPMAIAGMSAEEVMEKMMSCAGCSPYAEDPEIGQQIRYDIFKTDAGFISSMAVANESHVAKLRELDKACEANHGKVMAMTAAEREEHLCPFCSGMSSLMGRDDVKMEMYPTKMGNIMVMTSSSDEGVSALHAYATTAEETSALLASAVSEGAGMAEKGMKAAKKAPK